MALPSLMQHLATLERGGLVESEKDGRAHFTGCAPGFAPRRTMVQPAARPLNTRLDQLDSLLLSQRRKK